MARLVNRQQVLEVQAAINRYMRNKNDTNFDRIFNEIREYELDPARFMLRASSDTNARVVDGLLDLVRKRAAMEAEREGVNVEAAVKRAVTAAANISPDDVYGETPLVASLINNNTQEREKIVRILLEHGADPNLTTDGRENFFNAIYEDEMNSDDLPERMASLQRIRDLLNEKQFNSPPQFMRFRPQAAAAPQAAAVPQANDNIIGGKKKKTKRTQKKKKTNKKKKSMKKRKTKTHRKK